MNDREDLTSELNRNELEVMRILWSFGELTPTAMEREFSWEIDNGSVRYTLRNLMAKGLVKRRRDRRGYTYRAVVPKTGLQAAMVKWMAHVFTDGSVSGLIAPLVDKEEYKEEDLEMFRRLSQEREAAKPEEHEMLSNEMKVSLDEFLHRR